MRNEMKVRLDVYSGRPNPSWELTVQDVFALAKRLIGLSPANRTLPESGLGYGGFTLANPERLAGLPVQIQVFHGIIGLWENGHPMYYHDLHHIEAWLIELARQQGYGAILDQLIGNDE